MVIEHAMVMMVTEHAVVVIAAEHNIVVVRVGECGGRAPRNGHDGMLRLLLLLLLLLLMATTMMTKANHLCNATRTRTHRN